MDFDIFSWKRTQTHLSYFDITSIFEFYVPAVNKESLGLNFAAALQRLFPPCPSLTEYSDRPLGLWVELHLRIKYNQPSIISSPLLTIICSLSTPSSPLASISLIWIFPSLRQEIEFEQVAMTPTGHSWNWHKEPAGKIYFLKSLMSCLVFVPTKIMR